ncbi:hypothetical protein QL285_001800 [Trifolium repens]|nr:hypothetical protein QL285_001800 [Trifolium repens]
MALFLFWWFYFNGSVSVVICVTVVVESGVDYSDFFRQWWSAVRGCVNGCYASAALMLEAGVVLVARCLLLRRQFWWWFVATVTIVFGGDLLAPTTVMEVLFCSGGVFSASVQVVGVGSNFFVVLVRFKNAFSLHKPSPVATQSDCKYRLFAYTSDFWRPPSSRLSWCVAVCLNLYGVCLVVGVVFLLEKVSIWLGDELDCVGCYWVPILIGGVGW